MTVQTSLGVAAQKGSAQINGLVAFHAVLKDYYLQAVRDLNNNKRILSRLIRRNTEAIAGRQAVISLNTGRNEGGGYVAEGAQLPDPLAQPYDTARYNTRYGYHRILFTGPAVASSRNDRGAFVRIMDAELRGAARDMQHEDNRIMFGDGSGRLCRIAVDLGAANWTVDRPGGLVSTALGTQYLRPGMRICIPTAEANALQTGALRPAVSGNFGVSITAVDYVAGNITLAEDIAGAVVGDFLYRIAENSATITSASSGRGNEPNGVAAIISDVDPVFQSGAAGFWPQGLGEVPATSPQWQSAILDNGGVPVPYNIDFLNQGQDLVDILGDGVVDYWMTSHGIRRQHVNILAAQKTFPGLMELDGGYRTVAHNGVPIIVDKDCTRGRIYGLDTETIEIYYETDYEWMDADGSILRWLPDHDAYQACLYRYWQMGTWARNRNVGIFDIQDN